MNNWKWNELQRIIDKIYISQILTFQNFFEGFSIPFIAFTKHFPKSKYYFCLWCSWKDQKKIMTTYIKRELLTSHRIAKIYPPTILRKNMKIGGNSNFYNISNSFIANKLIGIHLCFEAKENDVRWMSSGKKISAEGTTWRQQEKKWYFILSKKETSHYPFTCVHLKRKIQ